MTTTLRLALIGGTLYDELYSQLDSFSAASGIATEVVAHLPQHELNELLYREARHPTLDLDLVTTHTKYSPSQRDLYQPLDGLLDQSELTPYITSTIDACRIDGELCQLPRNCDVRLMIYRSDLYEQAGLEVPTTWDAVRECSHVLREHSADTSGFVFTGVMSGLVGSFYELLTSAGGAFLSDDGTPQFVSPAGSWALESLADLYSTATPAMADWSYDEVAGAFAAGEVATYTEWPGYWSTITEQASEAVRGNVEVSLYPIGPAGRRCVYGGCHSFAITTQAQTGPSLELLRWLTRDETLALEANRGSLVPKPAVLEAQIAATSETSLAGRRLGLLLETMQRYILWPPRTADWPIIEDSLWPVLRGGYMGAMDIERALQRAADAVALTLSTAREGQ